DPEVLAIVLSGNGPDFSAGHDLGSPSEIADREIRGWAEDFVGVFDRQRDTRIANTMRWRNNPKPTIAMVHGKCIFGGWMVAASMDLIFASDDALFLPSHTQYFSAPWDLGVRKAKEILFQNRFIPAREALELGFVNQVYPVEALERKTLAYANEVAQRTPLSLRQIKHSINNMQDGQGFTTHINASFMTYATGAQFGSPDPRLIKGKRQLSPVAQALAKLQKPGHS
ncbi:MAG: enoyl-CoA hydratase-related protein, partial [Chloroflexi bacterium]|nr:enoyl-CoA hydratase-related protein [Chloroflexota bacterium]